MGGEDTSRLHSGIPRGEITMFAKFEDPTARKAVDFMRSHDPYLIDRLTLPLNCDVIEGGLAGWNMSTNSNSSDDGGDGFVAMPSEAMRITQYDPDDAVHCVSQTRGPLKFERTYLFLSSGHFE